MPATKIVVVDQIATKETTKTTASMIKGTKKAVEGDSKLVVANAKRSADASPEGMPNQKQRPVFQDLTNKKKKDLTGTLKQIPTELVEKRITRSQSVLTNVPSTSDQNENVPPVPESKPPAAAAVVVSSRKSKRLSDKRENAIKNLAGRSKDSASGESAHETSYETADEGESFSQGEAYSSPGKSEDKLNKSSNERSLSKSDDPRRLLPVVPEGVHDFDAETAMDPFSAPLYAQDIFDYFKEREGKFLADKYLKRQTDISRTMRGILVDWMAEVQESFELNHESLYLAVKLVDLYLSRRLISKNCLQLLGSTAMLVAAKFDERTPPVVDDFLYICDDAYDRHQLLRMEIKLLKTIDFDLGIPLSYSFLRRYARCSKQTMELLTLARYILELSLLEYDMIDIPDSLMAAASLSLALQMKKMDPWSATLEHYSGYRLPELTDLVHRLNTMRTKVGEQNLSTIPNKYAHKVFFQVAKIPPLDLLST